MRVTVLTAGGLLDSDGGVLVALAVALEVLHAPLLHDDAARHEVDDRRETAHDPAACSHKISAMGEGENDENRKKKGNSHVTYLS